MEDVATVASGTVDPEVRAFVTSLVTAIGGTGAFEDGRYVLGDDALACLRDLKRWLRLYDEKLNRLDVARVLAERNLVKGDLLEILAAWPEEATEDRIKSKTALACLELLVPLTWPLEKSEEQATTNHYRNFPYLQLAQISYKREILEHPSNGILRAAVRAMLPSLALPSSERTVRDDGIIKLVLYLVRNVTMIAAPANLPVEWNENEVSRSATVQAFQKQEIFTVLLTIASNIEDFANQDVAILEILFHLFKGIDVNKLFMNEVELEAKHSIELKDDLKREASMLRAHAKTAPTRHNRFGTMIWVKRDEGRGVSCVSGQDVLSNAQSAYKKMDQSKKYNRPIRRSKEETSSNNFGMPTPLSNSATQHLRAFVEEFLDSGFNPLMYQLRRAIEREAERVLEAHSHQFFYLIAWCLEAERARRRGQQENAARKFESIELDSYSLVASVLNQETFVLLNRFMEDRLEHKLWLDLNSGMRSFIQILLTVQEMADSALEEDKEVADNIQNRIFYEETTHDRVLAIVKGFKDQGFSYLDACTELAHVFLRLLERYSKQNLDLQVRSRRRTRKKQKKDAPTTGGDEGGAGAESETEELAEAQRVSRERKFDFGRFAAKFVTQNSVNTFAALLAFYNDLSITQLKRVHRFFYRVAFKQEMSVLLYRMDIIHLLYQSVRGPTPLDKANPIYGEWEEFAKQLFRRLVKKMQERPALAVEVLFSKLPATAHYLEYGYEKDTASSRPRAPAELEVKGGLSCDEQIGVVVATLYEEHGEMIDFVRFALEAAAEERKSWEVAEHARRALAPQEVNDGECKDADLSTATPSQPASAPPIAIRPTGEDLRLALFKNNKLHLLLTLCGCERVGDRQDPDARWTIPSFLNSHMLQSTALVIHTHQLDPKLNYANEIGEEPIPPEQLLRRKAAVSAATDSSRRSGGAGIDWGADDDSELDSFLAGDDDERQLFPAGGPTPRAPDALEELKLRARLKRKRRSAVEADGDDEGGSALDEALRQQRRKARLLADLAKRRKIKSTEFVHDSDEEEDADGDATFFQAEEERRQAYAANVHRELANRRAITADGRPKGKKGGRTTRKKGENREDLAIGAIHDGTSSEVDEHSDGDEAEEASQLPIRKRMKHRRLSNSDAEASVDEGNEDADSTPPSSQSPRSDAQHDKTAEGWRADAAGDSDDEDRGAVRGASKIRDVRMTDYTLPTTAKENGHDEGESDAVAFRSNGRRGRMVVLDDESDAD